MPKQLTTITITHDRITLDRVLAVIEPSEDGVRLDIPEMVEELKAEIEGGGVGGGGHLVVGSIKFVRGMRVSVIEALVDKMARAELDEELGSSTPVLED